MLADGDELLLGDPAQPVIVRCRVKIEDDGRGKQEIIAKRDLSELPEVQGKIERDPARPRRCTTSPRSSDGAGSICRRCSTASPRPSSSRCRKAGYVAIDLADDGRMNTVFTRSQSGERPHVSRSVVRAVQRGEGALILARRQAGAPASRPMMTTNLTSGIIGVPLWDGETIRGVIQVRQRSAASSARAIWIWSPPSPTWRRWRSRTRGWCSACASPRRSCAARSSTSRAARRSAASPTSSASRRR